MGDWTARKHIVRPSATLEPHDRNRVGDRHPRCYRGRIGTSPILPNPTPIWNPLFHFYSAGPGGRGQSISYRTITVDGTATRRGWAGCVGVADRMGAATPAPSKPAFEILIAQGVDSTRHESFEPGVRREPAASR